MKKLFTISILSLFVATLSAQEKADTMYISLSQGQVVKYAVSEIVSMGFVPVETPPAATPGFPVADDSQVLNVGNPAISVRDLLYKAGIQCTDTLGRVQITDEEYAEIKSFTDSIVNGLTNQYDIYVKCYDWVRKNVKYAHGEYVDNSPYPVFTVRKAVCQGYANLLFVMLHSQGVPAMLVNGMLEPLGGHAWNYVNCDGTWYVSDPTNSRHFKMSDIADYAGGDNKWFPWSMDVVLFKEKNCWFDFLDRRLNVCKVISNDEFFVVPYSVNGFRVTSFNPTEMLPSNIRELYIGDNIDYFGENNSEGVKKYAPNVEYVYVDPKNTEFRSYNGVVYQSWAPVPVYIPAAMKRLELMTMETIGKNVIYNHENLQELVVAKGTKSIEGWAVENCPNLRIAYIPESTEVDEVAFMNVHKDFKIIRIR